MTFLFFAVIFFPFVEPKVISKWVGGWVGGRTRETASPKEGRQQDKGGQSGPLHILTPVVAIQWRSNSLQTLENRLTMRFSDKDVFQYFPIMGIAARSVGVVDKTTTFHF